MKPFAEDFEAIAAGLKKLKLQKAVSQYPWLEGSDYNPNQVPACTGCYDAGYICTTQPGEDQDSFAPCPVCGNPHGYDAPDSGPAEPAQPEESCMMCEGHGWINGSTPSGMPIPMVCPDCGNPDGRPCP